MPWTADEAERASAHGLDARSGFTIIELMVVLMIAGLAVMIALPRIDVQERRLEASVRESWAVLSSARQQAVLFQHDVLVEFDSAGRSLHVIRDADNDGEADADEVVATHQLEGVTFGRAGAPAGPAGAGAIGFPVPQGETQPRLVFHRSGSTNVRGGFYIRTARAESAPYTDEVRALTVERATGQVAGYHPSGSQWARTF